VSVTADRHFRLDYQLKTISNCIEGPERPVAFLLGAGCPCSLRNAGKPLIGDIEKLSRDLEEQAKSWPDVADVFNDIWSDLGSDPPNVEEFLTAVRLHAQMSSGSKKPRFDPDQLKTVDSTTCKFIRQAMKVRLEDSDAPDNGYRALAHWVQAIDRQNPVQVFTTNYDLLLEQALESGRVPYFDGFIGANEAFFDPFAVDEEEPKLPRRWVRLWKLHGSVNWWLRPEPGGARVFRSPGEHELANMIYPSHLKYDQARQMPFLVLFERLRRQLQRRSSVLVCVGFSFFDEHIVAAMAQALSASPQATLFALQYKSLGESDDAKRLAKQCHNATVICPDGVVSGGVEAPWLEPEGKAAFAGLKNVGDFVEFGRFLGMAAGLGEDHLGAAAGGAP
jgi:hypothetical protein